MEALVRGMGGELKSITVTGPLGKPVVCEYGIIKESGTAVIEMAGAAGITMVDEEERNPLYTTTYGCLLYTSRGAAVECGIYGKRRSDRSSDTA